MKRTFAMLLGTIAASSVLVVTAIAVAASSPTVATGTHTQVTDTSAVLHGTINPNGSATTYYFQWGLTTAYGLQSDAHSAGRGTKAAAVSTTARDLIPGTTYHYRLVATNGGGTTAGADHAFTTAGNPPPNIATGPASAVSKNAATLTAVINPNKQATSYYFQYGTSTAYGSQTIPAAIPAGTTLVTVAQTIGGLEARTIFHFRIVALHGNTAPQPGNDVTFMTLPRHRPVPSIKARTTPANSPHKPFVFTTSGSVKGPNWIPSAYDCRGNVTVRFLFGQRQVGFALLPLGPTCRFSGQTVLARRPGHVSPAGVTVRVRYAGNGYLTPRRAPLETVGVG